MDAFLESIDADPLIPTMVSIGPSQLFMYDAPVKNGTEFVPCVGLCPSAVKLLGFLAKSEYYCPHCGEKHADMELETFLDTKFLFGLPKYLQQCHGKVLVLGDSMAYATYLLAQKPEMDSVCLVPWKHQAMATEQFLTSDIPNADKVRVVQEMDPTAYLKEQDDGGYDYILPLLWTNPQDFSLEYRLEAYCSRFEKTRVVFCFQTMTEVGAKSAALVYFVSQSSGTGTFSRIPGIRGFEDDQHTLWFSALDTAFFDELFEDKTISSFTDMRQCLEPENYVQMIKDRHMPMWTRDSVYSERKNEVGHIVQERCFLESGTDRVVLRVPVFVEADAHA